MTSPRSAVLLGIAVLVVVSVSVSACGSTSTSTNTTAPGRTASAEKGSDSTNGRSAYFVRVRDAVLRGAARDFAQGTGIGGPAYESCVRGLLRRVLDPPTIARLIQVYHRSGGQQFAAQALNILASPLGKRCGHRSYVPELIDAAHGLRQGRPADDATRELGIAYGPYLGVRCRRADHVGCDRVGIDVVFADAATRVAAVVGGRRLRLHTPGMHNGIEHRDWVGTVANAGMGNPASPFYIEGSSWANGVWAGSPPLYVPVELRVKFAGGRTASALVPQVFVSPGWG
jgi:hypothetical protein